MNLVTSKRNLSPIKDRLKQLSERTSTYILIQLIIGLILIVLFGLIYYLYFSGDVSVLVSNFIIIDIYSFISGLGLILFLASVGFKVLTYFTIIFLLLFLTLTVLIFSEIFSISKNFKKLGEEEEILTQAATIQKWLIVYLVLSSIAFLLPSVGWIIALILANACLNVGFYNFHLILTRYGLKLQIHRNSAYLVLAGSFVKIVFALLLFIDIAFLPGIILGSVFYYFAFYNLRNHIKYIAPVLKDAPPPPSIPAPSAPPPRPVIGANGKIEVAKVPSPPASEFDEDS